MSVPVVPDEGTAREWLEHELRDPVYAEAQPGPVQRALEWFFDLLGQAEAGPSPVLLLVVVLVIAAVVALVLWRTGPLRASGRTGTAAGGRIGLEALVTADEYRRRADAAAAAGDWRAAVLDRFRGLVRGLEERTVLDARPGRTADEAAADAGVLLPAAAAQLAAAARVFDDVAYGDRTATAGHHETVRAADATASAARLAVPA